MNELRATKGDQLRADMMQCVNDFDRLAWTEDAANLVQRYVAEGVFTPALLADARHVAIATVHRVPILLSWNFRHLVNRSRRLRVNLVNSLSGYEQIEIRRRRNSHRCIMFDYRKIALEAGLNDGQIGVLEQVVRAQHVGDEMMFELRMLRTVRLIAERELTIEQALRGLDEQAQSGCPRRDNKKQRLPTAL